MSFIEDLKEVGVKDGKDANGCMRWAFGDDYLNLSVDESIAQWNIRHGDIFLLHANDKRLKVLRKIGQAYLEQCGKSLEVNECPTTGS